MFYCKRCNKTFDREWETIWDMQELTHGYVGYHLYDIYICCPDCGELAEALEDPARIHFKEGCLPSAGGHPSFYDNTSFSIA